MSAAIPSFDFLTGIADWENSWPFEDAVPTTHQTAEDETSLGENTMFETTDNTSVATWHKACAFDDLSIGAGTCVLVGGEQVAIFRVTQDQVRAVQNQCPHKGAAAMHQGLVGERGGQSAVFCPLHKRAYSLDDGKCLDEDGASLRAYGVRIVAGMVEVQA